MYDLKKKLSRDGIKHSGEKYKDRIYAHLKLADLDKLLYEKLVSKENIPAIPAKSVPLAKYVTKQEAQDNYYLALYYCERIFEAAIASVLRTSDGKFLEDDQRELYECAQEMIKINQHLISYSRMLYDNIADWNKNKKAESKILKKFLYNRFERIDRHITPLNNYHPSGYQSLFNQKKDLDCEISNLKVHMTGIDC